MRPRFIVPFFTLVGILLTLPLSHAETKVLTAEATYTMGDGESPSFAEAQVLQRAKQIALEQAGIYVESYTKVHNYDLTTEEIQTLAGGVLEVEVLEKSRKLVGDGLRFSIKIKATVTTDKMEELARRIKGKNVAEEYKKLQAEYAKLSQEVETWKQLAQKTPPGPERDAAIDQIREREKAFARVQQSEVALFQRTISGQALVSEGHDEMVQIDSLVEWIKRDGHIISIGRVRAFPSSQDRVTLTVPITVRPSALLQTRLSGAARALAGDGVQPWPVKKGFGAQDHLSMVDSSLSKRIDVRTTSIELVSLSSSRPVEDYFKRRVKGLVLVAELNHNLPGIIAPISCRVPPVANRLIFAYANDLSIVSSTFEPNEESAYLRGKFRHSPDQHTYEYYSVLLLTEGISFTLEFNLTPDVAKRLDNVTARWVDKQDAQGVVCRIILENAPP